MRFKSGSRNSQTQTTTAGTLFPLPDTVEAVEYTLEIFRGNTGTLISDAEAYFNIVALQFDSYGSASGRVCDCVVEQEI